VPAIRNAQIVALYLFDIAETVDLLAIPALVGGPAVAAKLAPKPATPSYLKYETPPLTFDGDVVGLGAIDDFAVRFRVYDYGVIAVMLTRPFSGEWADLAALSQVLIENEDLERRAEQLCRTVIGRVEQALTGPRKEFLSEDYLVFAIHELDQPTSADQLIAERSEVLAEILRGERQTLSDQERYAILQHRLSYLADDLIVPTWNAALVYDTAAGAQAALDILEFANSQLLQYRYYDRLLDAELAAIYARLQQPRWYEQWLGSRHTNAARHVHSLFIDVNELTDRTENALKFIGDVYAARLFSLVSGRLGLAAWKANIQEKLETLDDIYRFSVEQSAMTRGQFMELSIVLILVLELVLILLGVMK
jgi:hypothetical protein